MLRRPIAALVVLFVVATPVVLLCYLLSLFSLF